MDRTEPKVPSREYNVTTMTVTTIMTVITVIRPKQSVPNSWCKILRIN